MWKFLNDNCLMKVIIVFSREVKSADIVISVRISIGRSQYLISLSRLSYNNDCWEVLGLLPVTELKTSFIRLLAILFLPFSSIGYSFTILNN